MNDAIIRAAEAARLLAEHDPGFDPMHVFTDEPISIDAQGLLLAYTADAKPMAMGAWLRGLPGMETAKLAIIPIDRLANAGREAMSAGKLVVAFGYSHLWNAQELDALSFLVVSRPRETYALVLTGAEGLRDPAELELAERGLRRLLPLAFSSGNNTSEQANLFLWSDEGVAGPVQGRVMKDIASFHHWLVANVTPYLEKLQATSDKLREQLAPEARGTVPGAKPVEDKTQRLRRAREALSSIRSCLISAWSDAGTDFERQLEKAMTQLEQELKDCFAGVISRYRSLTREAQAEWEAEQKAKFQHWGEELATSWQEQVRHALSDVKRVADLVDWAPINQSRSSTAGEWYPDALIQGLNHAIDYFARIPRQAVLSGRSELAEFESARSVPVGLLSGAALGTALCVVVPRMPILLRVLVVGAFAAAGHTIEQDFGQARKDDQQSRALQRALGFHAEMQRKLTETLQEMTETGRTYLDHRTGRMIEELDQSERTPYQRLKP